MTPGSFSSTAPIHAFIVDANGRVRDRAALTGRVNIDRTTGEAVHRTVDRGTCHQTANLGLGPGTDAATVFGPFFVLPFNTTVVMPVATMTTMMMTTTGTTTTGRRRRA
jgi:hypothetical protein